MNAAIAAADRLSPWTRSPSTARTHRPGTILDVGAHDGLLTLPFARAAGRARAGLRAAAAGLRAARRRLRGPAATSTLRREALGAAPGTLTLSVPVLDGVAQEQWASLAKDYRAFRLRHDAAPRGRGDHRATSLGLTDLAHVKVDAEGFEQEVLAQAPAPR